MKIVLLENVKGIGQKGEIKEVKDGYAINFLIPQKKASMATSGNAKRAELEMEKQKKDAKLQLEENLQTAEQLEGKELTIIAKAQKEKLFGALTTKDIQEALEKDDINIGTGKITLSKPIKKIGAFDITIDWGDTIQKTFKLNVVEES